MLIYADNAATTAVSKKALEAMLPYFTEHYGNASSIHRVGQEANKALQQARAEIAAILGAEPKELIFTSGGSESDNQAIISAALQGAKKGKKHIISSKIEHHAVLHVLDKLEKEGYDITLLDVSPEGLVSPESVEKAIREDTALVTIMFANNEIGTIEPIKEIGEICRKHGVIFHTDAVQAVGHVPINVKEMNIDMLSFSAHKFHGPKGIGGLYVRKGIRLLPLIEGGAQERGLRAGTENVAAVVGMAAALKEQVENMEKNAEKLTKMRDRLIDSILKEVPRVRLNGDRVKRLPGNVNFCFEGIEGEALLLMLDNLGICGSSGSACTSGSLDPSHVLLAIGLPHEIAHGSLRLTFSEYNTEEEIDYIIKVIPQVVKRLRDMSPMWERIVKEEA
ncbi:MAG: cysteine desulfurase NifS [Clostridiales bacterium]|jgi:cysteine desulfurase|nr:cysteine desulfurase NifS [Clostridiales bacterium]HOL79666.1 cysteine desulfurase NifS [Clostridiales bacterium]HPP68015.1 cysteine desulfurase NifS [Clostridiales bacterium]HQA06176.1 cysteine desulfurase NifS [Clostridiales bacterium]HQD72395.1 cysteine desulfurase NifS [Clostridiales bacterium]